MIIVAERINATRENIRIALENKDEAFIANEAKAQFEAGADYIDLMSVEVDPEALALIPRSMAEKTCIFPISKSGDTITFACADPLHRDISNFTRQLSNLLDSGLTMLNALGVLIDQSENPYLKRTISQIRDDIEMVLLSQML